MSTDQLRHQIAEELRKHWTFRGDADADDLAAALLPIALAAWRDGYGLGRDDEAAALPLRDSPELTAPPTPPATDPHP